MNKDNLKIIKKILPIVLICAILVGFISYKLSDKHKNDSLNIICMDIMSENKKLSGAISDRVIDTNEAISLLTDNQQSLIAINNKLDSISVSSDRASSKDNLIKSISYNLKMDEQILSVLKNQDADDLSTSLNNIYSLYKDCTKYYKISSDSGLDISLPDEYVNFYNNCCAYINELIKFKRDNDITASQDEEFKKNINEMLTQFKPLTENLQDAINMIKKQNRDLNAILNDLDIKYEKFSSLKEDAATISYPPHCVDYVDLVSLLFTSYDDYIKTLKETISNDIKKESCDYEEAYRKYDEMMKNFNNLKLRIENVE